MSVGRVPPRDTRCIIRYEVNSEVSCRWVFLIHPNDSHGSLEKLESNDADIDQPYRGRKGKGTSIRGEGDISSYGIFISSDEITREANRT